MAILSGAHTIIYSSDPEADRKVLRDVFELPNVDVSGGWLIFALPPSEVAVHPASTSGKHELYFIVDDVHGFIERMKQHGLIPILLCIEVSRLAGLDVELGIDDFILSPIVGPELYARIRQLDWRLSSFAAAGRIKLGDLVIDTIGVEATFRGRILVLPRQEFQLLKFLALGPGRVFTREQLLSRVWGYRYTGNTRTVDIHVRRLRAKLGTGAEMIETVRHVGYKMKSFATTP